jgi:hypothetical protein
MDIMPSYRARAVLAAMILALFTSGCGDDLEAPIEKSPYEPSQAQMEEMKANMLKGAKIKPAAKTPKK